MSAGDRDTPMLTEPGWRHCDHIRHLFGEHDYRLLTYPNGDVRFEHYCDRGKRGIVICAPRLQIGNGLHTLTYAADQSGALKPTVRPSILCPDCNTHGYITDGRWEAV